MRFPSRKTKGYSVETIDNNLHIYSGAPKDQRAQRWVSVIIDKNLRSDVTDWEAIDENTIKVNVNMLRNGLVPFLPFLERMEFQSVNEIALMKIASSLKR